MKILHCADLHLGAKNSKLPKDKQTLLKEENDFSIRELFATARVQNFECVIICGDLFHSKSVSVKTERNFFDSVEKYKNPVVYIDGNHDNKFVMPDNLPKNFIYLTKDNPVFEYQDFVFYSQNFIEKNIQLDKSKNNILLLHGNIISVGDNDYVDISNFLKYGFDYIALGHIHTYAKYKKDNSIFAYSGSLFSNGFDELGEKGFLSVNIEEKRMLQCEFKTFIKRKYQQVECDISGLDSYEVVEKIKTIITEKNISRKDILKVKLIGYFDENGHITVGFLLDKLSEYFYVEIEDKTKIKIDIDKIKNEKLSLKYEFISLVENAELTDDEKSKICQLGIEALKGDDFSI